MSWRNGRLVDGDPWLHGVCFGPATPIIMVGATIAAGAMTAYSVYQQGQQTAAADAYNAQVAQQQATTANEQAQSVAEQQQLQTQQTEGQEVANAAASGVDPNSGSPLDVMSQIATQGELQKQLTLWAGQTQQTSYLNQAQLQTFYGTSAAQAGTTGAAGTLLSSGASAATNYGLLTKAPTLSTPSS